MIRHIIGYYPAAKIMCLYTYVLLLTTIHRLRAAPADYHAAVTESATVFHVPADPGVARIYNIPLAVTTGHEPHAIAAAGHGSPHWAYTNHVTDELPPDHWVDEWPACAGARQSPIPIDDQTAVIDTSLEPLNFSAYHMQPVGNNWTVKNNGHAVEFSGDFVSHPELRQGSLGANYAFAQFHFHWGAQDSRGSEHVMNDKRFPIELHLVHRKVSDDSAQAHADSTGYSVVGILFDVADETEIPNVHMEALARAVQRAVDPNAPVSLNLPDLNLVDLIPDNQAYYRYLGSLTTPPCTEAVVWNVMKHPLKITETQLNIFRSLHQHAGKNVAEDLLYDNYRPLQQPNGRVVRYHPDMMDFVTFNRAEANCPYSLIWVLGTVFLWAMHPSGLYSG